MSEQEEYCFVKAALFILIALAPWLEKPVQRDSPDYGHGDQGIRRFATSLGASCFGITTNLELELGLNVLRARTPGSKFNGTCSSSSSTRSGLAPDLPQQLTLDPRVAREIVLSNAWSWPAAAWALGCPWQKGSTGKQYQESSTLSGKLQQTISPEIARYAF